MSRYSAQCRQVPSDAEANSQFCRPCDDKMLLPNLCCDVCKTRRPTKVCISRFPLPMFCEECVETHIAKCGPEAHQLHPLSLYVSVRSCEDLLLFKNRLARIEYIKGKLAGSSLALVDRAQSELLFHMRRLTLELEIREKTAAKQIETCRNQILSAISRLDELKYYWAEQPENLYEFIALSDSSISPLIQSQIDIPCFRYRLLEGDFRIPAFFQCSVAIPSVPPQSSLSEEPMTLVPTSPVPASSVSISPAPRNSSLSSLSSEAGQQDDLVKRYSALLPFQSLSPSSRSTSLSHSFQSAPAALPKCLHCSKEVSDSSLIVKLACGHNFHDKECFFAYLQEVSTNFTVHEYQVACPQCLRLQGDSKALVVLVFGENEFLKRVDRVRQTACCLCGKKTNVARWTCLHRLCAEHKEVRKCPICKNW